MTIKNKDMSVHNTESTSSVVVGFILAIGNETYGWMNHILLNVQIQQWLQAIITGGLGAVGAFTVNRLLRLIEKKFKHKRNE